MAEMDDVEQNRMDDDKDSRFQLVLSNNQKEKQKYTKSKDSKNLHHHVKGNLINHSSMKCFYCNIFGLVNNPNSNLALKKFVSNLKPQFCLVVELWINLKVFVVNNIEHDRIKTAGC